MSDHHIVFRVWNNLGHLDKISPDLELCDISTLYLGPGRTPGRTWRDAAMWAANDFFSGRPDASSVVIGVREANGTVHLVDVTRTVTMDVRFAHRLPSQVPA